MTDKPSKPELAAELEDLRARLAEAEEVLRAVRNGEVDAVVVAGERGQQIYTLRGADRVYRQLIETMSEGAVALSANGVILYCNVRLSEMLGRPLDHVLGTSLRDHLPITDQQAFDAILAQARTETIRREINLITSEGRLVPVYLSASLLLSEGTEIGFCLVLTDLMEQKRHEQISAAEQLARLILEQAAEAIVVCDEQGRIIRVSQAALGFCDDSPLMRPFAEVFPLRTDASGPFHLAPVFQGETLRNVDVTLDWQGQKLDLILNAGQLLSGPQFLGCIVTLTNITEHKRAEERIRKVLQLETALLRINTQILEGVDTRGALGTACEAIVEMGYRMCWIGQPDPDRIIRPVAYRGITDGYPENIVIPLDDSSEGKGPTGTAVRTGRPCVVQSTQKSTIFGPWRESAIRHGYLSMAVFPLKSESGEGIGVIDVYSDREEAFSDEEIVRLEMFAQQCSISIINARRIESLRDARQRLAFHVNQMPLAYIVWDPGFVVVEWNPAAERIFGWEANEAIGKSAYELIIPEEAHPQIEHGWSKLLKGDESSYHLNTNVRKDGKIITCEWFNASLRDASGNVSGVLSMAHDVTGKTELERQLEVAQRMEAVGTLAGGIAHDFNNALTGIMGFGELMRLRLAGDSKSTADLDEILRCAERAATLTRQLLTFARRQVIEPVNLNLSALVADLMKLIGKVVGEHIEVKTSLGKDVPTIHADRGQIEQVVMNLCLNARDAMPEGGRLVVETEDVSLEEGYVRRNPYMRTGRYTLLTVSDTGIGMEEKTCERVFEPFFTTKGPDKGTGLGLSMVYGIVKQHGGFIHLYSEPGKGTAFKLYFPATEAQPDALPTIRREETVHGGTETILLAEDEEAIRSFIERTLKELGYTVLVARNGEEAIEIFRQNKEIVLAVLDVVMPRKGGKEAFEEMHKQNPRLKAIFMSGYSVNAIHDSFVLMPGTPFLQKPFGPTILARKVREVLDTQ